MNLVPVPVQRVKEIQAMNRKGLKLTNLLSLNRDGKVNIHLKIY